MSDYGTFRIGHVAQVTGLSVAVLRAWDERYGLRATARSPGGQRLYSSADIRRVRRVQELVSEGWTVASAAGAMVDGPSSEPDAGSGGPGGKADAEGGDMEGADAFAALAAYQTTRHLLRVSSPHDVPDLVEELVERLGGQVVPALPGSTAPPEETVAVDVSFGFAPSRLPRAPAGTLARARLEAVLPMVVEDARRVLTGLSATGTGRPGRDRDGAFADNH